MDQTWALRALSLGFEDNQTVKHNRTYSDEIDNSKRPNLNSTPHHDDNPTTSNLMSRKGTITFDTLVKFSSIVIPPLDEEEAAENEA